MFDETLCDRCGDCLVRCLYVDYDKQRAVLEIDELIAGREAPILSACVTCFACNEYCPTDARPFDLILERQEQFGSLGIPQQMIDAQEARYAVTSDVRLQENEGEMTDVRFVELVVEVLQADTRYQEKMREVLEEVRPEASLAEAGSSEDDANLTERIAFADENENDTRIDELPWEALAGIH